MVSDIPKPSVFANRLKMEDKQNATTLPGGQGKNLKKPFIRKDHLTDRALKNHPGLMALKAQIQPRTS